MSAKPTLRCAIYTRKSSDEGLEQEFNSLDAQYEACSAYIQSQRHEGWKLIPERFDDGGVSGGTLERPALKRLLAEIEAGRIGMVVVYKIDRLTRSLADFVRLVERLDARGCSFVSVTQAFNTSSSMGRLTLNMLLSFAQFEREVTAERIRDKIAASKKKGLWMGGSLALGYDRPDPPPAPRILKINAREAITVRALFELHADLGTLAATRSAALARDLSPRKEDHLEGRADPQDPAPFSIGQLHYLLTNPVYIGVIRHKNMRYPGQHPPLIDQSLWDKVQAGFLVAKARPRGPADAPPPPHLLTGKVRDETGDILTPTHSQRHGRRFHYYTSHRLVIGTADASGWRLPAALLERAVRGLVTEHLRAGAAGHRLLATADARLSLDLASRVDALIARLARDATLLGHLVRRVDLAATRISMQLHPPTLAAALALEQDDLEADVLRFTVPVTLRRRGIEMRLITGACDSAPDPVLCRVLAEATSWANALRAGTSIVDLARDSGHAESYIRTRLPIAFLAPRLQRAILEGRQSPALSVARILREGVPLDWDEQERRFGDR